MSQITLVGAKISQMKTWRFLKNALRKWSPWRQLDSSHFGCFSRSWPFAWDSWYLQLPSPTPTSDCSCIEVCMPPSTGEEIECTNTHWPSKWYWPCQTLLAQRCCYETASFLCVSIGLIHFSTSLNCGGVVAGWLIQIFPLQLEIRYFWTKVTRWRHGTNCDGCLSTHYAQWRQGDAHTALICLLVDTGRRFAHKVVLHSCLTCCRVHPSIVSDSLNHSGTLEWTSQVHYVSWHLWTKGVVLPFSAHSNFFR